MIEREIAGQITQDLGQKLLILSGPRQCGKTTLARSLKASAEYLSWDSAEDRKIIRTQSWKRESSLVIFDEIHKLPQWKRFLKGIYDKEGATPPILVTGSARLDVAKKMGDSLAGRFFAYRLFPFDIKELDSQFKAEDTFERLMKVGGFPEPFIKNSQTFYNRWQHAHSDIILRQDLLALESLKDIDGVESLIELLKSRVGSGVSAHSLALDLEKDHKTIQRWLLALENLFIIFRLTPFSKNIARAKLKEPKFYFYDLGMVTDSKGARFENLVALSLLKELSLQYDLGQSNKTLQYLRTRDGKEIDFVVVDKQKTVTHLIEAKWSDDAFHKSFNWAKPYFPSAKMIQLVANLKREKSSSNGVSICNAAEWLRTVKI